MRLLMMGTGPFAVPTFQRLVNSSHRVLGLITRPIPIGKGTPPPNPMRIAAESLGIPVYDPASINSEQSQRLIQELSPDLFVVCDYGQILQPAILQLAPLGGINLHGSLLPKFRGAAPIQRAMLAGVDVTGISVIHMTPALDAGPVLATRQTPIGARETAPELESRLSLLGVEAVMESIELLAAHQSAHPPAPPAPPAQHVPNAAFGSPQDPSLVSRAPRLQKSEGLVDWTRSAVEIDRQVRALKPWPNTYSFWERAGQSPLRLILERVAPTTTAASEPTPPGVIAAVTSNQVLVGTGQGLLALHAVQPAGKRVMEVAEFIRGYPMQPGQRFGNG
jgi:methionyl-tRNA formyltransferase